MRTRTRTRTRTPKKVIFVRSVTNTKVEKREYLYSIRSVYIYISVTQEYTT